MARQDVPPGFVYDQATRGAVNPATGERLSRRALESARVAQEAGLSSTRGVYEAKAKQRAQALFKLPRKHRGKIAGQLWYRSYSFKQLMETLAALPKNAIVFVRVRGKDLTYQQYRKRDLLRWETMARGKFLAGHAARYADIMQKQVANMYDFRAFDVVVVGLEES